MTNRRFGEVLRSRVQVLFTPQNTPNLTKSQSPNFTSGRLHKRDIHEWPGG